MFSPAEDHPNDKMPQASREHEDYLDWLENRARSPKDCLAVDRRFLGGWIAVSTAWLVGLTIGFGSVGGLAVVGYCFFTHHLIGH